MLIGTDALHHTIGDAIAAFKEQERSDSGATEEQGRLNETSVVLQVLVTEVVTSGARPERTRWTQ